jgi:hypothetical protein
LPRTVVITQSNYLPWRGYFDMVRQADELIALDGVQYTRRDWRNRNVIRTAAGPTWLTVPVLATGRYFQPIDEVVVARSDWVEDHIRQITQHYSGAAAYGSVAPWLFERMREAATAPRLTDINRRLLAAISDRLGMSRPIRACATVLDPAAQRLMGANERLIALCLTVGAERYLTGPAAAAYLDVEAFAAAGIEVAWMNYDGYRPYAQCWPGFEARVSIVDVLLNCGRDAAAQLDR